MTQLIIRDEYRIDDVINQLDSEGIDYDICGNSVTIKNDGDIDKAEEIILGY